MRLGVEEGEGTSAMMYAHDQQAVLLHSAFRKNGAASTHILAGSWKAGRRAAAFFAMRVGE